MALAGMAVIVGRLVAGFCLDRLHGRYIALASFCCPMIGIALLALAQQPTMLLAGTALCGLGVGAEVDLMAYFIGRYFGMRAYGAIYGLFFAVFTIGSGIGPVIMGFAFDHGQSYSAALAVFEAALFAASGLVTRLGPYRYPTRGSSTQRPTSAAGKRRRAVSPAPDLKEG